MMPFRLKDARATYKRAATTLFHNMMHKEVEVYVDDMMVKSEIREEIAKQIQANFLEVVDYPQWLANIVPVPKKDEKVRMCIDFRDLNKACPKDDFPLPHIDVIVDSAASSAMYSFMDGFSGYNQIMMAVMDKIKTAFCRHSISG